ncbi:MAG: alpha/beta hydrolase [Clostridium sp.]|nr:alpha/beta hydrolase [Clostridium sp.]
MGKLLKKSFYKQRQDFENSCKERDKVLSLPDNIEIKTNIKYSDDDCLAHRLDIYRPKDKTNEILPVIINIHGGGLLLGNKEFNKYFCAEISSLGFMVYSIEYRLVPDCNFFDQLDDVSRAMDYINSRIISDNGDPSHIYGTADSGGAFLLLYSVAMQKSKSLEQATNIKASIINFKALAFISGMFYTTKFDKIGLFLPSYLYGKKYKKSIFAPYINPENPEIISSLLPCYLVTSHNDFLQNYTLNFEKALTNYNIPHKLDNYPKNSELTHAFSVFKPFIKESKDTIKSMIDFLTQY